SPLAAPAASWQRKLDPAARLVSGQINTLGKTGRANSDLSSYADRKSTRLNSSHVKISYAVFCLKKKKRKGVHAAAELHRTARLRFPLLAAATRARAPTVAVCSPAAAPAVCTLSLHDALPIFLRWRLLPLPGSASWTRPPASFQARSTRWARRAAPTPTFPPT